MIHRAAAFTQALIVPLLFVGFAMKSYGQGLPTPGVDPTTADYTRADSIALHLPTGKYVSYNDIVVPLTRSLHTDHEKARALFRWVTDNIAYSYNNRSANPAKAFKKKKAVCAGYAYLFQALCKSANISCTVITGYAKNNAKDINKKFSGHQRHAWNAVKLHGQWYLLDVCWASGSFCKNKFTKEFDEFFFLTPPAAFAKQHLPNEPGWQMIDKPLSPKKFRKAALQYGNRLSLETTEIKPWRGDIKVKANDTLQIKLTTTMTIITASIELTNRKAGYVPVIRQTSDGYLIKQCFPKPGSHNMILWVNGLPLVGYKLSIK